MATKQVIDTTTLECSLCLQIMTEPKLLKCTHTFCKKCLVKYSDSQGGVSQIPCPLCRELTPLEEGGVSELQTNIPLKSVIEEVTSCFTICTMCDQESQSPAVRFCEECCDFMCEACLGDHGTFKKTARHETITVEDAVNVKLKVRKCAKHPQEEKEWMCSTCNETVCFRCRMLDHSGPDHDIEDVAKYRKALTDNIKSLQSEVDAARNSIGGEMQEIENDELKIVDPPVDKMIMTINEAYDENMQKFNERRCELIKECNTVRDEIKGQLRQIRDKQVSKLGCINSANDLIETGLEHLIEGHARSVHDNVCGRLRDVLASVNGEDLKRAKEVARRAERLTFTRHELDDKHILGEVNVEEGEPSQNQGSLCQNQGAPSLNQAAPSQNQGSPSQNQGSPSQKQGTPSQNKGTPSQNKGTPSQNKGTPSQNEGTPSQNKGTPSQNKGTPSQNKGTPSQKLKQLGIRAGILPRAEPPSQIEPIASIDQSGQSPAQGQLTSNQPNSWVLCQRGFLHFSNSNSVPQSMVATHDGRMAVAMVGQWGSQGGGVEVFGMSRSQGVKLQGVQVLGVSVLRDGRCVVRDSDGKISLYSRQWKKLDAVFQGVDGTSGGMCVDRNDRIYVGCGAARVVRVFTPEGGAPVKEIPCHGYKPWIVCTMNHSEMLVVSDHSSVRVVDGEGKVMYDIKGEGFDARVVVLGDDNILIGWWKAYQLNVHLYTNQLRLVRRVFAHWNAFRSINDIMELSTGQIAVCGESKLLILHKTEHSPVQST